MTDLVYDMPLKFGLFHGPHHATNLDPTYAFERDLMLIEHLDRLGFDEAWIGEHHSGGFEIIAALPWLAAPLGQVRVGADQTCSHRRRIYRVLEALGKLCARRSPTGLRRHLRRDVPPPDHRELRQRGRPRRTGSGREEDRRTRSGAPRT